MVYYILEVDDIIKEDDELYDMNDGWIKVDKYLIGNKIEKGFVPFRRLIRIPSPLKPCFNCGYEGEDFMYDRTCPACMEEGV